MSVPFDLEVSSKTLVLMDELKDLFDVKTYAEVFLKSLVLAKIVQQHVDARNQLHIASKGNVDNIGIIVVDR